MPIFQTHLLSLELGNRAPPVLVVDAHAQIKTTWSVVSPDLFETVCWGERSIFSIKTLSQGDCDFL